jgi:hypothetical protein
VQATVQEEMERVYKKEVNKASDVSSVCGALRNA